MISPPPPPVEVIEDGFTLQFRLNRMAAGQFYDFTLGNGKRYSVVKNERGTLMFTQELR
jgi:hypothetical protein